MERMESRKIAIVTGASSGFGLLTSIELAKRGFDVIATMRDLEKTHALFDVAETLQVKEQLTVLPLDVTNSGQIESLKKEISARTSVDVLVNNAGYALGGFCEETTLDEYREQFETNFFGVIAVTQAVLPFMREQGRGNIINVSSISGLTGFPGLSPYVASKHALEGFTECLRLEMKPFGIEVALVEPGSYQTNIWSNGKRIAEKSLKAESPYSTYMRAIESKIEEGVPNYGDPQEVANLIADLCEREKIEPLRFLVGKGIKAIVFIKKWVPWAHWEKAFYKRLLK